MVLNIKRGSKSSNKTPSKALKKTSAELAAEEQASNVQSASTAVEEAVELINETFAARAGWQEDFPEASKALSAVKHLEDATEEAITRAKPLVAAAKQTVGPFKCSRKFSKAAYNSKAVLKCFLEAYQQGDEAEQGLLASALMDIIDRGMISDIKIDKDVARILLAQSPDLTELLAPAWEDRRELSPSISVPKL
jgi:hypothetical protein